MNAIYVNQNRYVKYADAIIDGYKPLETRSRDMLGRFVGQRVLIVRTTKGQKPMVIGSVMISEKRFYTAQELDTDDLRNKTLIPPGSRFDCHGKGKWCYTMHEPIRFNSEIPLSSFEVLHKTRTFLVLK